MTRVEELVRPHERDEVLGIRQIDDIMRPAGDHVDGFDLVAADLKADFLVRVDIAFFNQRATADDDEELPFTVMPVLTFRNTGLTDINRKLTTVSSFQKLSEATSVITVHLQIKDSLLRRKI